MDERGRYFGEVPAQLQAPHGDTWGEGAPAAAGTVPLSQEQQQQEVMHQPFTNETHKMASVDTFALISHPGYQQLVTNIYNGRLIGEDITRQKAIMDRRNAIIEDIQRRQQESKSIQGSVLNADLGRMMYRYSSIIESLNQDLVLTAKEANSACEMFEQQIRDILSSEKDTQLSLATTPTDEQHLRDHLKRKYSSEIKNLRAEFQRKKKKGKLPNTATDKLRMWWKDHLMWPYPSEDEKRVLGDDTKLNPTQINNWFINQRKRHWHKYFKEGCLPQSPEEAAAILRQRGVLK